MMQWRRAHLPRRHNQRPRYRRPGDAVRDRGRSRLKRTGSWRATTCTAIFAAMSWDDLVDGGARQEAEFIARLQARGGSRGRGRADRRGARGAVSSRVTAFGGSTLGCIGATLALSALGAAPVSSCNAGGFGGHHVRRVTPTSRSSCRDRRPPEVLAIARGGGRRAATRSKAGSARIYGAGDLDLFRFAQTARDRCGHPGSLPPA